MLINIVFTVQLVNVGRLNPVLKPYPWLLHSLTLSDKAKSIQMVCIHKQWALSCMTPNVNVGHAGHVGQDETIWVERLLLNNRGLSVKSLKITRVHVLYGRDHVLIIQLDLIHERTHKREKSSSVGGVAWVQTFDLTQFTWVSWFWSGVMTWDCSFSFERLFVQWTTHTWRKGSELFASWLTS